jgi:hypothetical protein
MDIGVVLLWLLFVSAVCKDILLIHVYAMFMCLYVIFLLYVHGLLVCVFPRGCSSQVYVTLLRAFCVIASASTSVTSYMFQCMVSLPSELFYMNV